MVSGNRREPECGGSTSTPNHHWGRSMQLRTPHPATHINPMSRTSSHAMMISRTNHHINHYPAPAPNHQSHALYHLKYTRPHCKHLHKPPPRLGPPVQIHHCDPLPAVEIHHSNSRNTTRKHMTCHQQKTSSSIYTALWVHPSNLHSLVLSNQATFDHSLASAPKMWRGTVLPMQRPRYWGT
jgi:hypothetical protein